MRSYNKGQERVCTKKRKNIFVVERGERKGAQVHKWTIEERVYQTLEITLNSTSVFL